MEVSGPARPPDQNSQWPSSSGFGDFFPCTMVMYTQSKNVEGHCNTILILSNSHQHHCFSLRWIILWPGNIFQLLKRRKGTKMPTRTFESKTIYKLNENEIMKRYKLGFEIEWNSVSYSLFQESRCKTSVIPLKISLKSYKTSRKLAGPKSNFLAQCNPRRDRKMCWNSIIL